MRKLKLLIVGILLGIPGWVSADAGDIPGAATWYFHVDLEQMRSADAGKGLYDWMVDEIFDEVKEESGIDVDNEVDRLTAYSVEGQGPIFLLEGNISQMSKDRLMTLIAAEGDLQPQKSSGKSYYRMLDGGEDGDSSPENDNDSGNIELEFEALENEAWVSTDLKNKVVITSNEEQMKSMLKSGGKITGSGGHDGALMVLSAEKTLLQAGMNSAAIGVESDGGSGWDSNILRNTEQVAVLVAATADKLAIQAKLVTSEPEMANSLASVVRGLISLTAFSDEMESDAIAVLQGTKVEADGRNLNISLALDPEIVVSSLRD